MVFLRCKSFIPVFWIILFYVTVPVKALSDSRDGNCLSILPESYDRTEPPRHKGRAANVFIQLEVLDLDEISEASMDFRLHCFIRASWKDPRISLNSSDLSEDCVKDIWIPDLFFSEAKLIIETGQHNTYLALRNGYFYMSIRYSFKVACMMDFHLYPFDTQHCEFSMSFMSNDDSAAVPKWFDDEESPYRYKSVPVLVTKEIEPLQFIIGDLTTHSHSVKFMFANFTYLVANVTLSRRLIGSIVNYYMPSALCVLVSWVTFWLQSDASSERVTLTMTALLTICTQGDQYKSELPPVNYITAMDIWYFVCISMLVATLLEFAFSYNARRKNRKNKTKKMKSSICCKHFGCLETSKDAHGSEDLKETEEGNSSTTKMYRRIVNCIDTTNIDSVSKVLFPSFFITFTVVYWSYYYRFMHVNAVDVD